MFGNFLKTQHQRSILGLFLTTGVVAATAANPSATYHVFD
jgi:hypothetical protein